jgi:hypothetical protein
LREAIMLAGYLVQAIERDSDALTDALVRDLRTNDQSPSFQRLPVDGLRARVHDIYRHLSEWLAARSEPRVDATFAALGRQRFAEQIPLEELVFALMLTKQHLRDKVAHFGQVESAIELHYENDLHAMIDRFFDRALHAMVKGYEEARREPSVAARGEPWAKFHFETSANVGAWMP